MGLDFEKTLKLEDIKIELDSNYDEIQTPAPEEEYKLTADEQHNANSLLEKIFNAFKLRKIKFEAYRKMMCDRWHAIPEIVKMEMETFNVSNWNISSSDKIQAPLNLQFIIPLEISKDKNSELNPITKFMFFSKIFDRIYFKIMFFEELEEFMSSLEAKINSKTDEVKERMHDQQTILDLEEKIQRMKERSAQKMKKIKKLKRRVSKLNLATEKPQTNSKKVIKVFPDGKVEFILTIFAF